MTHDIKLSSPLFNSFATRDSDFSPSIFHCVSSQDPRSTSTQGLQPGASKHWGLKQVKHCGLDQSFAPTTTAAARSKLRASLGEDRPTQPRSPATKLSFPQISHRVALPEDGRRAAHRCCWCFRNGPSRALKQEAFAVPHADHHSAGNETGTWLD